MTPWPPSAIDAGAMSTSSIAVLERWAQHGGVWRTKSLDDHEAVVDLLTCHGEPVDQVRSTDPELLRFLARRSRSDDDTPID
jgi:hypothetical protein